MLRPSIRMIRFYPDRFLELATDEQADIPLRGPPFGIGGSGHARYDRISRDDLEAWVADAVALDRLERNGVFLGGSDRFYWSDYAPDQALLARP